MTARAVAAGTANQKRPATFVPSNLRPNRRSKANAEAANVAGPARAVWPKRAFYVFMKKSTLIAAVVVLVAVAALSRRWWVKSDSEVAVLAAGPAPAAVIPDSTSVVLSGRVGAGGTEPVRAEKRGRIRNLYFDAGQYVRRGAIIAKLVDYNFVTAPHDGFLGARQVVAGQYVKPGTVVTSISRRGYLLVPVAVPAGSPAHVQPGDSVRGWATSRPTRVVTGVAAAAKDTTGGINLEIRFTSRAPLRLGEAASVQLKR